MYEFASRGKNFPEKSSLVEKLENLPGESNKVRKKRRRVKIERKICEKYRKKIRETRTERKSAKLGPVRLSRLHTLSKRPSHPQPREMRFGKLNKRIMKGVNLSGVPTGRNV